MKKLVCLFTTVLFLIGAAMTVCAEETSVYQDIPMGTGTVVPGTTVPGTVVPGTVVPVPTVPGTTVPVPEDAFLSYMENLARKPRRQLMKSASIGVAGSRLTGYDRKIYLAMSAEIKKIASGERTDTQVAIPFEDLNNGSLYVTAEDLGVDAIVKNGAWVDEAVSALFEKYTYDLSAVVNALLADYPYELYWFDKTMSTGGSYFQGYQAVYLNASVGYVIKIVGGPVIRFNVAAEFSASGVRGTYEMDPEIGPALTEVAANAAAIVEKYKDQYDYNKLQAYRQEICDLVSYNHDAAGNTSLAYGNPWQLIWVFDGDTSTNVVCEGYSKAFQYLCDLSTFVHDVQCISPYGKLQTASRSEGHMWNILRIDDKNYLVDVTNCDTGTIGAPQQLFLAIPSGNSVSSGYTFQCKSGSVGYIYDSDMNSVYDEANLVLASSAYEHIPLENLSIMPASLNLTCGESATLTLLQTPANTTEDEVIWSITDTNVVSLDGTQITAESVGSTTITVRSLDGKCYASCLVNVTHKEVIDPAVTVTCTEDGLTQGSHCSGCGTVFVAQETIPAQGHQGGSATCTKKAVCEICHQEYGQVDLQKHTVVTDAGKAATCTEDGQTEGSHCSECGTVLVKQEVVAAKGHKEVIDEGKAATCTEDGLTEGKHCSECGTVLVEQEVIAAPGHLYKTSISGTKKTYRCSICEDSYSVTLPEDHVEYKENAIVKKKTDSDVSGAVFGKTCARIGATTTTSITIKWNGVSDATAYKIYAARCNSGGKVYQLKLVKSAGQSTRSYKYSKLQKGVYYKFVIMAVKGTKVLSVSKTIHIATAGGKYTNAKGLTLNVKSVSIRKGRTKTVKVRKTTKFNSKRTIAKHKAVKYETSNKKIATVTSKGTVKGVKKGSCYLYVYAQDGIYKKIKVTVK